MPGQLEEPFWLVNPWSHDPSCSLLQLCIDQNLDFIDTQVSNKELELNEDVDEDDEEAIDIGVISADRGEDFDYFSDELADTVIDGSAGSKKRRKAGQTPSETRDTDKNRPRIFVPIAAAILDEINRKYLIDERIFGFFVLSKRHSSRAWCRGQN